MSDYDFRPGGSLKIRGGVAEGGITKKYAFALAARLPFANLACYRKKKSKSKGDKDKKKDAVKEDSPVLTSSADGSRNSPLPGSSSDRKTEAERRFQEVQRKRVRKVGILLRAL